MPASSPAMQRRNAFSATGRRVVACNARASQLSRRQLSQLGVQLAAGATAAALYPQQSLADKLTGTEPVQDATNRVGSYKLSEKEWQKTLSQPQYSILRQANTERPFVSPLNNEKRSGARTGLHKPARVQSAFTQYRLALPEGPSCTFTCAGCGADLFPADAKFDSGTGWPSFYKAVDNAVDELPDNSIPFLPRTEVRCHRCQGHLGHVFKDGPQPTGLRYCMNGYALDFRPSA